MVGNDGTDVMDSFTQQVDNGSTEGGSSETEEDSSFSEPIEDVYASFDAAEMILAEEAAAEILVDITSERAVPKGSPERAISGLVFPEWWEVKKVGHVYHYTCPTGRPFRSKSAAFTYMQKNRPGDVKAMFDQARSGATGFRPFADAERRVSNTMSFPSDWECLKQSASSGYVNGEARRGNQVQVVIRSPTGRIYRSLTTAQEALIPRADPDLPKTRRRKECNNSGWGVNALDNSPEFETALGTSPAAPVQRSSPRFSPESPAYSPPPVNNNYQRKKKRKKVPEKVKLNVGDSKIRESVVSDGQSTLTKTPDSAKSTSSNPRELKGTPFDVGAVVETKNNGVCKITKFLSAWIHVVPIKKEAGKANKFYKVRKSELLRVLEMEQDGGWKAKSGAVRDLKEVKVVKVVKVVMDENVDPNVGVADENENKRSSLGAAVDVVLPFRVSAIFRKFADQDKGGGGGLGKTEGEETFELGMRIVRFGAELMKRDNKG